MQKKLLYESDLVRYWAVSTHTLYCEWTAGENYTEEGFRRDILEMADLLKQHHFTQVLDDSTLVSYPIEHGLQNWTVEVFTSILEKTYRFKKYALIMPKKTISMLSNEQIFGQLDSVQEVSHHEVRTFAKSKDAWKWLGFDKPVV